MPCSAPALAITFVTMLGLSAVRPPHPRDFVIEHVLTVLAVAGLVWADRRRRLSNASVLLVFCFLTLHVIGARYTYSEVPYDAWFEALTGGSLSARLGWTRNHYDRLVHAAFGLLLVLPARELVARAVPELRERDPRLLVAAVLVLAVMSTLYELLEWAFTLIMTRDAAAMYNGEQGDVRDAHKDMALALAGSLLGALVVRSVGHRARRSLPDTMARR